MRHVGVFLRASWFQYVALFSWATPVGYVSYKVFLPIAQIVFFVQLGVFATGSGHALYYAVGNALQLTAINGIFAVVQVVANERRFGTLPLLLGSPANRVVTFLGRAVVASADGMVAVAVGIAVTVLLYGLDLRHANLPLLLLCVVVTSASTSGLGLMFGSIGLVFRDAFVIGNVVYYLLLIVCGINFPVSALPGWLQVVSYSLPLTRGVQAARSAVVGADTGQVAALLAGELAVGMAYFLAGYLLFLWIERLSRHGGLQDAQ